MASSSTSGSKTENAWKAFLVVIGVLYVIFRAYRLTYFALWRDEAFSVNVAVMPWTGMFRGVIQDIVHPPLFYILLKVWIWLGGTSILWMRLLPLLISVATLIPLFLFCNEWKLSKTEMALAFTFVTFNQLLIAYSQELRMYSLLVGLSLTSLWLLTRFLQTSRGIWWLTLVNFLLAFSHYYGALFVAAEAVYVLWCARQKRAATIKFLASSFAIGLLYLPWLYLVARAAKAKHGLEANLQYFSRPTFRDVFWFYDTLKGELPVRHTAVLGTLLFAIPIIIAFRSQKRDLVPQLALFTFFPTLTSVIVSYLSPEAVFSPRFLITVVIPFLMLAAIGIAQMPKVPQRVVGSVLLAMSISSGLWFVFRAERKIHWDVLAQQLATCHAPVFTYELHEQTPLEYYGIANTMLPRSEIATISQPDFCLVYRSDTWRGSDPAEIFASSGFHVAEQYEAHDMHEKVFAIHFRREPMNN